MAPSPLYLHGIGHFHPETVITNDFFQELGLDTSDEWITERVGIRTRRTVLSLDYLRETRNRDPREARKHASHTNAQTAAHATRLALKRAHLDVAKIGMVIAGGCSPEQLIPAEAAVIAHELGIIVPCMDLHTACSSFVTQLHFLRSLRPEATPDYILVVNAENTTRTVNYGDRASAVLWGDATAATVVSLKHPSPWRVNETFTESDPSGWSKVRIPAGGHFEQEGKAVQAFAIRKTLATLTRLRESLPDASPHAFIGHQANLLMLNAVCERAEIKPHFHYSNVQAYGNGGAAGAPSVLSQHWDTLPSNLPIAMAVVGSGLTWGGLLLEKQGL